ncbi:zinc finger MYM-type protein 1-like [Aphis craccivora]|uniref:Zinc finger MYM-type protein 1-like n=1 Tax=Aphis craccivora TaxID=307492 RepID=A0A6G0WG83_APHCR|nr:zinc finger MYM-type protein 1-like [Aphis craccivora]
MKRGALDKFFKPAVKNPRLVHDSKRELEENTTVTTEITMNITNVRKIELVIIFERSHEKIGALVSKPFIKWKDAIEKCTPHSKIGYHRFCINAANNFSNVVSGKMNDVATQLISQRKQQREENRSALKPIIPRNNNFLWRTKNSSQSCQRNATCLSPTIQNDIIDICGNLITKKLVTDINKSGCFTILCDETLDVSGIEQLSLCARYINFKNQLREDFLCFIPAYDLSGENLANLILEKFGQGYDGAGNMSGKFNGVQSKIRQKYPKAMFKQCLSRKTLKNHILKHVPESKRTRLVGLCETRFIERHDAINVFVELFNPTIISLQDIQDTTRSVSSSSSLFLAAVEKSSFIISLLVCEHLLNCTLPLSHYLQNPTRDLSSAMNYANDIINKLKHLRNIFIETFSSIFQEANRFKKLYFDSDISCPRIINNQKNRENYDCNSPEEYYRASIFVPSIGRLILKLENRVSEKVLASEFLLWCYKWVNVEKKLTEIMDILDACDKEFYPNIHFLMKMLATLPISTTTVERSFSTLKRLKTLLRNKTGNERLTCSSICTF